MLRTATERCHVTGVTGVAGTHRTGDGASPRDSGANQTAGKAHKQIKIDPPIIGEPPDLRYAPPPSIFRSAIVRSVGIIRTTRLPSARPSARW